LSKITVSIFEGCLFALLRFCVGALVAGIGIIIILAIIYQSTGGRIGDDSMGISMFATSYAFLPAILGGAYVMLGGNNKIVILFCAFLAAIVVAVSCWGYLILK